jgi:hypothetical protein
MSPKKTVEIRFMCILLSNHSYCEGILPLRSVGQ